MKKFITVLMISLNVAFAGGAGHIEVLSQAERTKLNIKFDCFLKSKGLGSDVVGNGSCDNVSNGSGDIVGNGSGDIVGNGGGVIEGKLQYLLQKLPDFIRQSILMIDFDYPPDMAQALVEINELLEKRKNKLRLVFLSGPSSKKFFFDESDQSLRSAKTGFSEEYPIYINIEYLYKSNVADQAALITLLVHELGHQVGYTSHSFLDILGAEVARIIDLQKVYLDGIWLRGDYVDVNYLNFKMDNGRSTLSVSFNDQATYISSWDQDSFEQICGQYHPIGFRYRNVSWKDYSEIMKNSKSNQAKLEGVIQLNCSGTRGEIRHQYVRFELDIQVTGDRLDIQNKQFY